MTELKRMSWRELLKVHPAAETFPLMGLAELKALGADIKANGLKVPIALLVGKNDKPSLLDGRNRLDAVELIGFKFSPGKPEKLSRRSRWHTRTMGAPLPRAAGITTTMTARTSKSIPPPTSSARTSTAGT
jgi:hypothetical protein